MDNSERSGSDKPEPTKHETAAQHTGSADVSYGANSNLTPGDVSETAAAQEVQQQHQASGAQTGSDPSQQQDQSGVAGPSPDQPGEETPLGQSGNDRNRPA
jgi:hypothetical protein